MKVAPILVLVGLVGVVVGPPPYQDLMVAFPTYIPEGRQHGNRMAKSVIEKLIAKGNNPGANRVSRQTVPHDAYIYIYKLKNCSEGSQGKIEQAGVDELIRSSKPNSVPVFYEGVSNDMSGGGLFGFQNSSGCFLVLYFYRISLGDFEAVYNKLLAEMQPNVMPPYNEQAYEFAAEYAAYIQMSNGVNAKVVDTAILRGTAIYFHVTFDVPDAGNNSTEVGVKRLIEMLNSNPTFILTLKSNSSGSSKNPTIEASDLKTEAEAGGLVVRRLGPEATKHIIALRLQVSSQEFWKRIP